ncbi:hypothetical protein BGX38DRAFT_1280373 [Terfezia claveryi]|nr:hypothetical protein BGX38DRAFT_1280373 [Terfezia claveryi]
MSGTGYHDLQEVCVMVLEEPLGWVEVVILGNHQNGKDTHVRGLQVFAAASPPVEVEEVPYTSSGMLAELGWR